MKKTLFTLSVDNYAPEISALTFPLLQRYASKIGADFQVISERKFPGFPPQYEKLQIYELGKGNDWNIYIDADALVHPDTFDVTDHLSKDTVLHNGKDQAGNRWTYDRFFRRDGRHIGSCNWFTIGSDWCIDLWKPLDDLTLEQAIENIHPVVTEQAPYVWRCSRCNAESPSFVPTDKELPCRVCQQPVKQQAKRIVRAIDLLDDYVLSRNIAKFGLKFQTFIQLQQQLSDKGTYLWHVYTSSREEKLEWINKVLRNWGQLGGTNGSH